MLRAPWRKSAPRAPAAPDVDAVVRQAVEDAIGALPVPQDGQPGKDGETPDPALIGLEISRQVQALPAAKDGKQGLRGPPGPEGPEGPMGPMPDHRWVDQTKLQFEHADGVWGKAVDLKGPKGDAIVAGGGGGGSSSTTPAASGNNYFPGGWT